MAKSPKSATKKKALSLKKQIAAKLAATFAELKVKLGDKKFNKKVKKASKILASGAVVKPLKASKSTKKVALPKAS